MAISKVILNGVTQMDVTGDTVASGNLLSGYTATGADGEAVSGGIVSKTASDVTVSGNVVTIPAGYYATEVQKTAGSTTTLTANAAGGLTLATTGEFPDMLSGTTWTIAATPTLDDGTYALTFTSNGNTYTSLTIRSGSGIVYDSTTVYSAGRGWAAAADQTIAISGGDDVDNIALANWLGANTTSGSAASAVNKVIINSVDNTDLTGDTAIAEYVLSGATFHLANGKPATGTGSAGGGSVTITGVPPLTFEASASPVQQLVQYGKMVQEGTPSPSTPAPIKCNNGTLTYSNGAVSAVGTAEVMTLGNGTASVVDLLAVGSYKDEHNILTGAVRHRADYHILTGEESFSAATLSGVGACVKITLSGWRHERTIAPVCTHFEGCLQADAPNKTNPVFYYSSTYLYFKTSMSVADFTTWVTTQYNNGTPVIVFFAKSTNYQRTETVTAQSMATVSGTNTLSVNTDICGEVMIEYNA